jgi:hypothetical protein
MITAEAMERLERGGQTSICETMMSVRSRGAKELAASVQIVEVDRCLDITFLSASARLPTQSS